VAQTPSDTDIEKLVRQLGSNRFGEREAAGKALDHIGYAALPALRRAAMGDKDPENARRAVELVRSIEDRFDSVVLDYRALGLPFPHHDAPLVRYGSGGSHLLNGKLQPLTYRLGFLTKPGNKKTPWTIMTGTFVRKEWLERPPVPIYPDKMTTKEITSLVRATTVNDWDAVEFAVLCKERGWSKLAQALFDHYCKDSSVVGRPGTNLHQSAWSYWTKQLREANTDWKQIGGRLRQILEIDQSLDDREARALLRSLDAALVPRASRLGSFAAMIDDLIDCRCRYIGLDREDDPRYMKIARQGFTAVPELIKHLDDSRLTRTFFLEPYWGGRAYHGRVAHLVSDLLQALADEKLEAKEETRSDGPIVTRASAQKWWERVNTLSEEDYVSKRVLGVPPPKETPAKDERVLGSDVEWPNAFLLAVITEKYPLRLPALYRLALDQRPYMETRPLADAISRSKLPHEKKLEPLLYGARSQNLHRRAVALEQLIKLDREQSIKILLDTLNRLPASPKGVYWNCPAVSFASLAQEVDDPRAWEALLRAAKRADVGLRMEYLHTLSQSEGTPRQHRHRAAFLAEFLDDATLRVALDKDEAYNAPYAGWAFPRLEVRNFVALEIADLLDLPGELPGGRFTHGAEPWTAEQWAKLRGKAREAVNLYRDDIRGSTKPGKGP
jgi:hypothetical protein